MEALKKLATLWSMTQFSRDDLIVYAEGLMVTETRRGVMTMSFVSLLLLVATSFLYTALGFGTKYSYTNALLAVLSLHIFISARFIREIRTLHLLGMTLVTISGVAFVLLAHHTGSFSAVLLTSVVLLFMVVPMVPWGMKEASLVVFLIYGVFTLSTLMGGTSFDRQVLVTLQFVMLGAAVATLTLVGRSALVRRDDIEARFELENAHKKMEVLSFQDALTGAWNRRYLQRHFRDFLSRDRGRGELLWFVVLDVNDFKQLNDSCGHDYGDKVLQWVTQAFQDRIGDRGIVVRMGGDEFAVLFAADAPEEVLEQAMGSVSDLADRSRRSEGLPVTVSAGLVPLVPDRNPSLEQIYKQADEALYRAKSQKDESSGAIHLVRQAPQAPDCESPQCASRS